MTLARLIGGVLLSAVIGAWLVSLGAGYDVVADVDPTQAGLGPGAGHPLGTDHLGRDVLWRLLTASQAFVGPGLFACLLAFLLGMPMGAAAGWFGGAISDGLRYGFSVVASLPRFVLVLLVGAIYGDEPVILAAAAGLSYIPALGEAIVGRVDSLRRADFVSAARAHGISDRRILLFHLLWVNCRSLIGRHMLYLFGYFLLLETTLSYIGGFGVEEPQPSWGNMLAFEFGISEGNLWAWLSPALAIWSSLLSVTLLAESFAVQDSPPNHRTIPAPVPQDQEQKRAAADPAERVRVQDLHIFAGEKPLVRGASLQIEPERIVALVGGSGSGKSLTARASLGLLRFSPGVVSGDVEITVGEETHRPYTAPPANREEAFSVIRGPLLGYLPQDARAALDPVWTVRQQLTEILKLNHDEPSEETLRLWLQRAGFPTPAEVLPLYPHELSGGMAQRVCVALSLARGSRFLIADEPTTGLDPSVQRALLTQLAALRDQGLGVLLITHDLRLIPQLASKALVMDSGQIVETLAPDALEAAQTPQARRLVSATARIAAGLLPAKGAVAPRMGTTGFVERALRLRGISRRYRRGLFGRLDDLPAVDQVDLTLRRGEVLGLIGESGSGKTTLARIAAGMLRPERGTVEVLGADLLAMRHRERRNFRKNVQLLFQSPMAHLNPGLTIERQLRESARLHQPTRPTDDVVEAALHAVDLVHRRSAHPRELSGGELRRAGVAQVLIADPEIIIADEPTSGLDAGLKADLLDVLLSRRDARRAYLFISHDLPLIAYAADRIAVMVAGRVVEVFPVHALRDGPHHPYTLSLLADAGLIDPPDRLDQPAVGRTARGCPYRGPCARALPACSSIRPLFIESGPDHRIACHAAGERS
ncbi:MAG: ATP-binding cassette domain-containing protein [Myxococcota bacterium]